MVGDDYFILEGIYKWEVRACYPGNGQVEKLVLCVTFIVGFRVGGQESEGHTIYTDFVYVAAGQSL